MNFPYIKKIHLVPILLILVDQYSSEDTPVPGRSMSTEVLLSFFARNLPHVDRSLCQAAAIDIGIVRIRKPPKSLNYYLYGCSGQTRTKPTGPFNWSAGAELASFYGLQKTEFFFNYLLPLEKL